VDALGNPVRAILTAGQQADITQAEALIAGFAANAVLADKGYDADAFVATIESQGAHAVIPPRSNRTEQRSVDWHVYKNRNLVERFFNRLKQFRRVATRYDKLDTSFLSFIFLDCSIIWLL
jgi:transposase